MSNLLTIREVAARLGVKPRSVYQLIYNGRLPARQATHAEIVALIAARRIKIVTVAGILVIDEADFAAYQPAPAHRPRKTRR